MARPQTPPLTLWGAGVLLLALTTSTSAVDRKIPLDCQPDWTLIGYMCYRFFPNMLPWDSAERVCQSYGSHQVKVKDFYENDDIGKFVMSKGFTEYWIGARRTSTTNQRAMRWSDGSEAQISVGYWQIDQPDSEFEELECAVANIDRGRVLWSLSPCEKKSSFVCQRASAPEGFFHCHNGNFVPQGLKCDNDDDCGDGSDELDCNDNCTFHVKQMSGTIKSPNYPSNYPANKVCSWLIELPLGSNVKLEFTDFITEPHWDEVLVLAGGQTVSTSRMVAQLSGNLSASPRSYISLNNFLMVLFTSNGLVSSKGFTAEFSAVKEASPQPYNNLTATTDHQELISPFYPMYVGSQDYTWIITAEHKSKIVTLEIVEVDLKGQDRIVIRDGDTVHSPLLERLGASGPTPSYVMSTGDKLYITMQTRGMDTGKGFKFNYWEGCSISLTDKSGEIKSPGYDKKPYSAYQTCTYNVTVPGGATITVNFDEMQLHKSDRLLVYEGSVVLHNLTGSSIPRPFDISSGSFSATFESDAVITAKGFKLTYSVFCKDPHFNDHTVLTPPTSSFKLGTSVTVSCTTGYAFYDQLIQHQSSVQLECQPGGKWNRPSIPVCEPKYCGQAPPVEKAYVVRSTNVTYKGTVTYLCYPGFAMTGEDTITCTENGTWTDTPTCQTSSCSPLPDIANANKQIRSGDGSNFSSIVEYTCSAGYQIVGHPLLFCQSDGNWSASVPSCEVLQCYVPMSIPNGMLEKGGEMIQVGDSVTASCHQGYAAPGGDSTVVTCSQDRSLQGLQGFHCSYQDKCKANDYCQHLCHDSEFENRTCSCFDGYTLAADMKSCNNIDECTADTDGCDQNCKDTEGGYECSCDDGFILFTSEGVNGYSLALNENGMRPGDVRRFNHTCLPVRCPDPEVVANGTLLVAQDSYHYGDCVEYTCMLGFQLSGASLLTCDKNGQWDKRAPNCEPAMCQPEHPDVTALNPATVTPSGQVSFEEEVTLTCMVPGRPVYNTSRTCIYHEGKYQLVGANYDCGLIDCQEPETSSGSNYIGTVINTTYGSSFEFVCQDLYSVEGSSEDNDTTVRCTERGQWSFGSLRCAGVTCKDPGQPPDGQQLNTTSYDQDSLVYFKCDKEGFTLTDPFPLQCQLTADRKGLIWNGSVPQCVDTQAPSLKNCPPENLTVPLFSKASEVMALPDGTDNVGVHTFRVYSSYPGIMGWPSEDYILSKTTIFLFKVTDFAGNEDTCFTGIQIKDDIPPIIECPDKVVEEFSEENETKSVTFSSSHLGELENNDGKEPVFTPAHMVFTADANHLLLSTFPPYATYSVTAYVEDSSGNKATCKFPLFFKAKDCSPYTLRKPLNGTKNCTKDGTGFQCMLSCDDGYVFYDHPDNASLTYSCTDGGSWTDPDIPACVKADDTSQQAGFRQTFRYTFTKAQSGSCGESTIMEFVNRAVSQAQGNVSELCNLANGYRSEGELSATNLSQSPDEVSFDVTLTYDEGGSFMDYESCSSIAKILFETASSKINHFFTTTFEPTNCPSLSNSDGAVFIQQEYFCTAGKKKIEFQGKSRIPICVGCPEGTRKADTGCELCPVGHFSHVPDSDACTPCPSGTSTFAPGAVSNGECASMCASGTYSTTGLPPCQMCPKNTFSLNSTFCEPCPEGHVTRNTGAKLSSECLPLCPVGTYDPIDGHGHICTKCPRHFYADQNGTKMCTQCSESQATMNEGSSSESDCQAAGCNIGSPCKNGGTCATGNHVASCECPDGYNGQYCEEIVDPCSSNPCYFGGTCTANGTDFNCACITGTTGDRCEQIAESCTSDYCLNGGACRNEINGKTCLCKPGYSGDTCQISFDVCSSNPCKNGGTCVSQENVRFICLCPTGYEDPTCETNTNDCASNPCFHGGSCTDKLNDFDCTCPSGFSGTQCETRQQLCTPNSCAGGTCVEDYDANTFHCVCPEGNYYGTVCQYEVSLGQQSTGSPQSLLNVSSNSVEQCLEKCEQHSCKAILFDQTTSHCLVYDTTLSTTAGGNLSYYERVCNKVKEKYWTPWYDVTNPSPSGSIDDERVTTLKKNGLNICNGKQAVKAECRVVTSQDSPKETLSIHCTPSEGLLCHGSNQTDGNCEDYEIRFLCLSSTVLSESPCEDITYCSSDSVCQNGGTCTEAQTQATCACPSGYVGSLCQHSRDDCSNNPCVNGTCVDGHHNFTCNCLPGYQGDLCETNTDDCVQGLCNSTGTQRCLDHVNQYECQCKPGFTGQYCQTEIDECLSQPCLHNGTCMDQEAGFRCTCMPGWTGNMCEEKVKLCNDNTCHQGGSCANLFNDFYCSCHPNTYGKTCNNAPSICINANPCLHSSFCNETMGVAQCECSHEFVGDGCHIRRDMCSQTNPACQNGATCMISQDTFSCTCKPGYRGRFCEENIDDCKNCPPASTCIDMVNQHFCRCSVGKSGGNCDIDTDRDFDLMFFTPDKSSMAALGYPLHLAGSGFTITMWIQYLKREDTGTFFTLYKVREGHSLSGKEELIRVDHGGATVSLNSRSVHVDPSVELNGDRKWHYIALTWNKDTGIFALTVDTIRNEIVVSQGMPLDMFVWMVLGCNYNTGSDGCVKGQGFNGFVSQVTLYNRTLKFTEELTIKGNEDPFAMFPDAVMAWGEFLHYQGVTRISPSRADKACPPGFDNYDSCNTPVSGKKMVSIDEDSCPSDIVMHSTNRVTRLEWPDVQFRGNTKTPKSSPEQGELVLWGKYPVVVEASNTDGNKALCTFDIYVQYSKCGDPRQPASAENLYCDGFTDEEKRKYKQCNPVCKQGDVQVIPSPVIHTCGPVGSWDPPNRYLPYVLSPCGATSTPKHRLVAKIVYHVPSRECGNIENYLPEAVRSRLQEETSKWTPALCKSNDCSDVQLTILCSVPSSPKRSAEKTDIEVTISVDDVVSELTNKADTSLKLPPKDLLRQLILSDTVFHFEAQIAEAIPDPDEVIVEIELLCQAPLALLDEKCVECREGTYYNNVTKTCDFCPIGQYQPQSNQTVCIPCDGGTITETVGSTSPSQCGKICPAGQFFDKNKDDCAPCGQGLFQNVSGLFYCLPCPADKTTREEGANSQALCFNDCPIGRELTENGTCADCAIGFYKPSGPTVCQKCPDGLVTTEKGADSQDDCNVVDNPPGYYRSPSNATEQLPCPVGTYQPEKWQYNCIQCVGENNKTEREASASYTDCKIICPAGQQKVENKEVCEPCSVGFFRTGSNPYSSCEPCPNNTRSVTEGSISVDNCTITYCTAGYKISGSGCESCPKGTYQDKAYQSDCIPCIGKNNSTREKASTSVSDCETYCDPGSEKNVVTGECDVCPRGYYKHNEDDVFMECTPCHTDYVTPMNASTSKDNCTVRNCTEGYYIEGDSCQPCDFGQFQPLRWQSSCLPCGSDKNTSRLGAVTEKECILSCPVGKENIGGTEDCIECRQGYYKDEEGQTLCTQCPSGNVTRFNGSTSQSDCSLRACKPGSYADSSRGGECTECGYGEFQPQKWQEQCKQCQSGLTTYQLGADHETLCLKDCPSGQQLVNAVCEECMKGYYRNKSENQECKQCPPDLTTQTMGAVSEQECSIPTCNPGQYFDSQSKRCEDCQQNTFQNRSGQSMCVPCPPGFVTQQSRSTSLSQCLDKCDVSNPCGINATCNRASGTITCVCKDGYLGNGTTCTHKCDADYCQNSVGCERAPVRCICKSNYHGEKCQTRMTAAGMSEKDIIITATITTLAFLLLLIALIVCCCLNYRKQQKAKMMYNNDTLDERASFATRMSTRGFDDFGGLNSKPPSVSGGRLFVPAHAQQMYENPTYTLNDGDPAVYKI
ncbi:uncharacterized protein LOC143282756 isoform X2 [Babylonia areolata]|uniref:uncharacterized protein LOC143282756 isoform X2 n=1 Tax=Babylonia areolata TaxID=304850 RepID=UPI003FD2A352